MTEPELDSEATQPSLLIAKPQGSGEKENRHVGLSHEAYSLGGNGNHRLIHSLGAHGALDAGLRAGDSVVSKVARIPVQMDNNQIITQINMPQWQDTGRKRRGSEAGEEGTWKVTH